MNRPPRATARASGFSLVEILVGVGMGMIGIVVMMQMFTLSETNKRTASGGDDAQNNGAIALFSLQRDLRHSGYGTSAYQLLGCNVQLRAGVTLNAIAPVTINHASIPAGDANTDTLLIVYGNTNGGTEGDAVILQPATATYTVATPTSYRVGDRVIAETQVRPSPCNLNLEQVQSITSPNVTVSTGVSGMANGTIFNFGQTPRIQAYAIRSGKLTVCDYMASNCGDAAQTGNASVWTPVADNIVSLRAEYGKDSSGPPMDTIPDAYNQITPGSASDATGFALNCGWARIVAVRIALVARSGQYDKEVVTSTAPAWNGDTAINLSASTSPSGDWQHYRYRVFQTVTPLRNVIALGVQTGC